MGAPSMDMTMQALVEHRQNWREGPVGSYDGGKGGAGVYQQIINQIPPHETYIEAFLGDGRVLRTKRPAAHSIGVEVDAQVLAQRWRGDEVPSLALVCRDALTFLKRYRWKGGEFIYLDPPYPQIVRSAQRPIYRHEFRTIEQHRELLKLLRSLPCPIAVSSYWSWLYELELAGWRVISFQTVKHSGEPSTEYLWMNYGLPVELHDYQFLGDDFRERERIGRECRRWQDRLRRTADPERQALFMALQEVRSEIAGMPLALLDYYSLGCDFRGRERVARKCARWQEALRRKPALERQALFAAIDEVWRELQPGAIATYGDGSGVPAPIAISGDASDG